MRANLPNWLCHALSMGLVACGSNGNGTSTQTIPISPDSGTQGGGAGDGAGGTQLAGGHLGAGGAQVDAGAEGAGGTHSGGAEGAGGTLSGGAQGAGGVLAGGSQGAGGASQGGHVRRPSLCQLAREELRISDPMTSAQNPTIVWTGSEYLVLWSDQRTGSGDLYAARVSAQGMKEGTEWPVATTGAASFSPSLAQVGNGFLVGWAEARNPGWDLLTRGLDAGGQPIDTLPHVVGTSEGELRGRIARAFGAGAAVWMNVGGIGQLDATATTASEPSATFLAAIDPSGAPIRPPEPIRLGNGTAKTAFPALAASDTALAVAYVDYRDGQGNIRVSLFDSSYTLIRDVLVRNASRDAQNPALVWDGKRFVVAWEDLRTGEEQIYAARVYPDGTMENPAPVPDEGTGSSDWPSLAADGSSTAIAYYQFASGPPQVFLSLFGEDGEKRGGDLQVSHAPTGKARFPSIARGATGYGVVWQDTRDGLAQVMFALVSCP